jgi:NADPH:quinone reductase
MRAIVLTKFGGVDSLVYKDIPEPEREAHRIMEANEAHGKMVVVHD